MQRNFHLLACSPPKLLNQSSPKFYTRRYPIPFPNGIAIKVIGSRKTPIFRLWLPWQRPLKNQKKLNEVSKPLHPSTNPEILVKITPLASELRVLESRPLKINKK